VLDGGVVTPPWSSVRLTPDKARSPVLHTWPLKLTLIPVPALFTAQSHFLSTVMPRVPHEHTAGSDVFVFVTPLTAPLTVAVTLSVGVQVLDSE